MFSIQDHISKSSEGFCFLSNLDIFSGFCRGLTALTRTVTGLNRSDKVRLPASLLIIGERHSPFSMLREIIGESLLTIQYVSC